MNRNNVDQRFPDEGKSPEKGKYPQEESGKSGRKPASARETSGDQEHDQGGSEDRTKRPRVLKRGEGASQESAEQSGYRSGSSPRTQRPYSPHRDESQRPQRPYSPHRDESQRPQRPYSPHRDESQRPQRPYDPNRYDSSQRPQRPYDPNRYDSDQRPQRPYDPNRQRYPSSPGRYPQERIPYDRSNRGSEDRQGGYNTRPGRPYGRPQHGGRRPGKPRPLGPGEMFAPPPHPEGIRINRYIANAGICSRRDADKLVEAGEITVNGVVVNTLGARIDPGDVVAYKGVPIQGEKLRYILLNKPKGYITSNDDPEGRATVMELIADCCNERLFPVGRLDRNTTGLLLFTNDGILAEKLMHPRNLVKKLYHIKLDKPLEKEHMKKISMGLKLEDGWIKADQISYVGTVDDRTEVGMEIHSGKNRIVRRIFESLGYDVIKLDRVMFAGLTKKDIRRGKWRSLTTEELNYLKML